MLYVTVQHLWEWSEGEMYTTAEAYNSLSGIFFSLNDNKGKEEFATPVGQRATVFRFKLLQRLLKLACAGQYQLDIPMDSDICLDQKPFWMEGDAESGPFITEEHIKTAQSQHEKNMSNTPNYHRRAAIGNGTEPDNDDIAVYVDAQLCEKMKKMLRERRRRVNEDFVEVFAYLFTKWEKFGKVKVSDKSLAMRWVKATGDIVPLGFS